MRVVFVALAGATLVAGCGGGSGGQSYEDRLDEASALTDELESLPLTTQMPTSGTSRYEGNMGVLMGDPASPDVALLSDFVMEADFAEGTVSGDATDFFGRINGDPTRDYAGSVSLANGQIGPGNFVTADAAGVITGGGDVVNFDAFMNGEFVGVTAQGVAMIDSFANGTLNGQSLPTQVFVQGRTPD